MTAGDAGAETKIAASIAVPARERHALGSARARTRSILYAFDLDQVVPADHLVRQIDGALDLDWVHKELAPYYSHTGVNRHARRALTQF